MPNDAKNFSRKISKVLLESPARITLFGFLLLIAGGTALLMLPVATRSGGLSLGNALFTATSASCVTGLVVVDTGRYFSLLGQIVILLLIQIGGLGIMTLSTFYLLMAGKRLSLAGRVVVQDSFTHSGDRNPAEILKSVIMFTLVMEGLGAGVLFFRFLSRFSVGEAAYQAVFHAVSAFCNAGFSLFSESFIQFQNDWIINLTLMALIVTGGIGFLVIAEARIWFGLEERRLARLSLHSKIVLSTTAILTLTGAFLILCMEWGNTLAELPPSQRFLAALFQSVTARTAGFNTLPIGNMANETLFALILLMFIGASPGSCGGGIKTTTFTTLTLLGLARLKGSDHPQAFHRKISESSVARATNLVMLGLLLVVVSTLILLITELGVVSHLQSRGKFLELLFEVVSAFGTVGLSMDVTPTLSTAGKLAITLVMFIGRVGPLVLAIAISRRSVARYQYAEEKIMIG